MAIEIVDFPMNSMVISTIAFCSSLPGRVVHRFFSLQIMEVLPGGTPVIQEVFWMAGTGIFFKAGDSGMPHLKKLPQDPTMWGPRKRERSLGVHIPSGND